MSGEGADRELGRLLREAVQLLEDADLRGANEVLERASAEALASRQEAGELSTIPAITNPSSARSPGAAGATPGSTIGEEGKE